MPSHLVRCSRAYSLTVSLLDLTTRTQQITGLWVRNTLKILVSDASDAPATDGQCLSRVIFPPGRTCKNSG